MGTGRLEKNALVRLDGREYRIQGILPDGTYQLEDNASGRIKPLEASEVTRKIRRGELVIPARSPSPRQKITAPFSEEELAVIRVRREYIRAMEGLPNTRERVEPVIDSVHQRVKQPVERPSFSTVYRWRLRYEKSGRDARSLLDNHQAKGNRVPRYPNEVIEICNGAIDRRYLRLERGTIQDALDDAMHRTIEENRMRPEESRLRLPSRRLVRRLISAIPAMDKYVAQYGAESARRKFRTVQGRHVTTAPLERAEIDHTSLDIMVIDERTHLPLGRPTLTLCIDDFTRCVMGLYIGFKPPSFESVAACFKDCLKPKDDLSERYPEISNYWPSFGVMRTIVLDNGREFHSESLETACLSLNIEMDYCPRRTPWLKGKIERFFGTMSRDLLHKIPGTTMSSITEKADYDPEKNAAITLADLSKILRKWIADVYHIAYHRGIGTSPLEMWNRSIQLEDIPLPDDSVDLDLVLSASTERVLTHNGIELFGLSYNGPELTREFRLRGPKQEVTVRYDPGDLGALSVSFKDGRTVKAPCLTPEYANGLSKFQHDVVKRRRAELRLKEDTAGLIKAKADLQRLITEALKGRRPMGRRVARYREDLERPVRHAHTANRDSTTELETYASSINNPASNPVIRPNMEFNEDELLDFSAVSRY